MAKLTPRQYAELLYEMTWEVSKAEIPERLREFLRLLILRRTTAFIPRIIASFEEVWNERKGISAVHVTSAHKLTERLRDEVKKALDKKTVELILAIDPTIIAGLRVRIKDTIIDGSIKARLARVKELLSQ